MIVGIQVGLLTWQVWSLSLVQQLHLLVISYVCDFMKSCQFTEVVRVGYI